MSSESKNAVSAFVEGAPPGELGDVVADIKALTIGEPNLLQSVGPAFQKYNEEQLTTVKLPGSGQSVLVSSYNSLGDGRYYDVESKSSFLFDHTTQKASTIQPFNLETKHGVLLISILTYLSTHAHEHYPASTFSVFPTSADSVLAITLVSNKYSPSNFWNGRWRSTYLYTPSSNSISGTINIDVHYYEDGNVRLTARKPVDISGIASSADSSAAAKDVMRQIGLLEKNYQEELNRGFGTLNEGTFKGLRRTLPVTRQKVEWEKVGNYRVSDTVSESHTSLSQVCPKLVEVKV
ncbi:F-actin-capping protein subunit alpha [Loxospora ochrophaea]|nr:F-actin-capping protein subunit alpha [Loxospora ochrophaea]